MSFRVALTFDAEHPDRLHRAGGTERVLAMLAARGVIATFFVQGRWAEAFPASARAIADAGHLVGNHSHYHARMPLLTTAGIAEDVRAAERVIVRITGSDPRPWFRCPFGAGSRDERVLAVLRGLGYAESGWDVDAGDWRSSATGPGVMRAVVAAALAHGDGARVLLHPWTRATERGLPAIVDGLRTAGAEFVSLDALA